MHTYTCDCGVHMSATDAETLQWGIESHLCAAADPLEQDILGWLNRAYGGSCWLFRPGHATTMVRGW